MAPKKWATNYNVEEVEALVEWYSEMQPYRHKLSWLVRYCDLDLALRQLSPKEHIAVLLVGLIGIDIRTAGTLMECSPPTAWRRYQRGLESLTLKLNRGY